MRSSSFHVQQSASCSEVGILNFVGHHAVHFVMSDVIDYNQTLQVRRVKVNSQISRCRLPS